MCYSMAEIEEQELREAKRACNFIWAAAENYELEPLFLAFASDGTADMYLNLIIGLTYKWYDQEKIDDFFNQLGGKDRELYEGLLWIGLENALYQKERKIRSVMEELRREYALENLNRYRNYKESARIEQIRNAHCRESVEIFFLSSVKSCEKKRCLLSSESCRSIPFCWKSECHICTGEVL